MQWPDDSSPNRCAGGGFEPLPHPTSSRLISSSPDDSCPCPLSLLTVQEAVLSRSLTHPYIVTTFAFGVATEQVRLGAWLLLEANRKLIDCHCDVSASWRSAGGRQAVRLGYCSHKLGAEAVHGFSYHCVS